MNFTYHPGRLVRDFHHTPRFGYVSDVYSVNNQQSGRHYGVGVGINGAIILGVGLILLVALLFSYFAVCCCRCCRCCKRAQGRRYCRTSTAWLATMTVVVAGLAVGSAVVIAHIAAAINNTLDDAQTGVNVVLNTTSCKNALYTSAQDLTNLEAYTPYSQFPYKPQIDNAISQLNSGASSIPRISSNVITFSTNVRDHSHTYTRDGRAGAIALAFVPTLLGLLLLITLPKNRCCLYTFRFFAIISLFVMALFWIIAAILLPMAIAAADACYDPDIGLYTNLNCAGCYTNNNVFKCDVCYFALCTDPDQSSFPQGTLHSSAVDSRNKLQTGISDFQLLPSPGPAAEPTYNAADSDMHTALDELNVLVDDTTCATLGSTYPNTRHHVCDGAAPNIIGLFIIQIIIAIAVFFMSACAVPLWNNHPALRLIYNDEWKAVPTAAPTNLQVVSVPSGGMMGFPVKNSDGTVMYQGEPGMDPYGLGTHRGSVADGHSVEMSQRTASSNLNEPLAGVQSQAGYQTQLPNTVPETDTNANRISTTMPGYSGYPPPQQDGTTAYQPQAVPQGTAPTDQYYPNLNNNLNTQQHFM